MRRKPTVYLEDDLLRATKVAAARTGKRDYQVVEQALRAYLGLELLERVGARSKLTEDEALDLNRTTRHWYTQAASCEYSPGEVVTAARAWTAAVTSGV
jgi:hypothetical protein